MFNHHANWIDQAVFYHIYPLGLTGAPDHNDFSLPPVQRLDQLLPWLDHIQSLGANAIYLGPVFQSTSHGYDTADYYQVDRRLGDNAALTRFSQAAHDRGLRLVLDAVFNHVGRDFWAFKDVQNYGPQSAYADWFHNLRFDGQSPKGDPFQYEAWQDHYSLVKLDLSHPHVRAHLFDAVGSWMDQFGIDGLRLDAADCLDFDFMRALHQFTRARRTDFWLMGEVIHGDYRQWANVETLDSVTNYSAYKGLYSSLADANYFEIAYTLNQQFGEGGIYQGQQFYNFVDNHDVDRAASKLRNPALLYPLYILLFTMPGIPSVYYGSEWGIEGVKTAWSDAALRPALDLAKMMTISSQQDLPRVISRLAAIRNALAPLQNGAYQQLHVDHQQLAFLRQMGDQWVLVALNSAPETVSLRLPLPFEAGSLSDRLNSEEVSCNFSQGSVTISLPSCWGRIMQIFPGQGEK